MKHVVIASLLLFVCLFWEAAIQAQAAPGQFVALEFAHPRQSSCDSGRGRFYMSPSRNLDVVVSLRHQHQRQVDALNHANNSSKLDDYGITEESKVCLVVRPVEGRIDLNDGTQNLRLSSPSTQLEHCSLNPNPQSTLFTFHLRNLMIGGWGYAMQIRLFDRHNKRIAAIQDASPCWIVVGRMAAPSPASPYLPRPMSIEEALFHGRETLRDALEDFNASMLPTLLQNKLAVRRKTATWISKVADEMVRTGHSVSSLVAAFASNLSSSAIFSYAPAANLYFEASVLGPKLAASLSTVSRQLGSPSSSLPDVLAASTIVDYWNEFEAESHKQYCEMWRISRETFNPTASKIADTIEARLFSNKWLECLRRGHARWPQHPLWSFQLGRALLITADNGDSIIRSGSPWMEACEAFEVSAATGNEPNARLNVALCDETIRDDPTRAVSLLRAEILDVIHRGDFSAFNNQGLRGRPPDIDNNPSIGALLLRLATVAPRIIASPLQPLDILRPSIIVSGNEAIEAYRVALADDLSCLVALGEKRRGACNSERGRVTRLLSEICGKGWWRQGTFEGLKSLDKTSSFCEERGKFGVCKRVLLCDPSKGACANSLKYESDVSNAPLKESGRHKFCSALSRHDELNSGSFKWPYFLRLGDSGSIAQHSLSLGFFLAFHGQNSTVSNAYLKYLLGRAQRCLSSNNMIVPTREDYLRREDRSTSGFQNVKNNPIRVAVISRFLHRHSVGLLMVGVLEDIANSSLLPGQRALELHVFSTNPNRHVSNETDVIAARIRSAASSFTHLPTHNLKITWNIIMSHFRSNANPLNSAHPYVSFDIALFPELGMDPATFFLAQGRVAHIQIAWWGHPDSSGSPFIDYFVAGDSFHFVQRSRQGERNQSDLDALASEAFSEQLVRFESLGTKFDMDGLGRENLQTQALLLRTKLILSYQNTIANAGDLQSVDFRMYICVQAFFKWHPRYLSNALIPILVADPLAIIIAPLPSRESGHAQHWGHRLRKAISAAAAISSSLSAKDVVELVSRIHLVPRVANTDMQALFRAADVILDTFPFGGGVTSLQALNAGAAPITLPEPGAWSGQLTLAMYHQLATSAREKPNNTSDSLMHFGIFWHCVALNESDYVSKAVRLANNKRLRQHIRKTIHQHSEKKLFLDSRAPREWARFLRAVVA